MVGFTAYFCFIASVKLHHSQLEADSFYDSKVAVEKMVLEKLKNTVEVYFYQKGELPSTLYELVPEYLEKIPADGWGNEYLYFKSSSRFEIKTLGEDGLPGGNGHDFDFSTNTIQNKR